MRVLWSQLADFMVEEAIFSVPPDNWPYRRFFLLISAFSVPLPYRISSHNFLIFETEKRVSAVFNYNTAFSAQSFLYYYSSNNNVIMAVFEALSFLKHRKTCVSAVFNYNAAFSVMVMHIIF